MEEREGVFVHCPVCGKRIIRVCEGTTGYVYCPRCRNQMKIMIRKDNLLVLETMYPTAV